MSKRQHRVSLESLRLLDAIDRQGSFAAAAQELCVVTSSITHAIRNLEDNLGLTLFDRTGRSARFTSQGRSLLDRGRHLLAQSEAFDDEVQLIATGWEPKLVIGLDQVMPINPFIPVVHEFFEVAPQTSLAIQREAAAGSWDALMAGRADLIVGAPAGGPTGGGYESTLLFQDDFVLTVAKHHALASRTDVIGAAEIAQHRSITVGDTTRHMPHLPYGLQDSRLRLSVPDQQAKLQAILLGMGCGFMRSRVAQPLVEQGQLVILDVQTPSPPAQSTLAWRSGENGRALSWWIDRLTQHSFVESLFH
jgi:DNA-binding transcriptional LysR family regulator